MLRSVKKMEGFTIQATDGEIGSVHEFYFDDQAWTIRYLVVDTGDWLPDRLVLISPYALERPDWDEKALPVSLTRVQVENSPDIDVDKPVWYQHEINLHYYYGWPAYWTVPPAPVIPGTTGMYIPPAEAVEGEREGRREEGDPHLQNTREVIGYNIHARDDEIGHVEDFLVDDASWTIHYMVVDTGNWLPGKKVLVAPQWIELIDWARSSVYVDLLRDRIEHAPEYDPSKPIGRDYEERLHDYYDRPKYWLM